MTANKKHLPKYKIFISVWTYLGWFGCVYFGKMGWSFASLLFPLISWIFLRLSFSLDRQLRFRLLVLFAAGILFDSAAVHFDLIQLYPPATRGWLPVWMVSLWLLFVFSLLLLQSLFQKRYFLASLFGAIFGPLSYQAGAQLGALFINESVTIVIYSIFWAIYMPSANYWLARRGTKNEIF